MFLARQGTALQPGIRQVADAYGPDKATIVEGDLAVWLSETFLVGLVRAPAPDAAEDGVEPSALVKERIRAWTIGLGSIAVVNIISAMLKSAGLEHQAFWLLRKTWRSYRTPDDTREKSYHRYNYNYGVSLLDAGLISNPIVLADDMSNYAEWKEHADQNAYEFLARSYMEGRLLAAGGQLACVLAYRGEVGKAMSLLATVTDEALKQDARLKLCDIAIASVVIYDIVQFFGHPAKQLQHCIGIAKALGDEPRRAILCAHLGRLLTYSGQFDEADTFLREGDRIGRRLDLKEVLFATQAARGLWLAESGASADDAVRTLQEVADALRASDDAPLVTKIDVRLGNGADPRQTVLKGHRPTQCRVLLDLTRAALFAGNGDVIDRALDELEDLTVQFFPGYLPHYYLLYAQCLIRANGQQPKLVAELIQRARQVGEASQNPWVAQAADHLEHQIAAKS